MRRAATRRRRGCVLLGMVSLFALALLPATPAHAKNHLWRFTQVFSNASGTIQFIEMQECCGSNVEVQMASASITSNAATFNFPNNLPGPTAFRWIVIATQGYAALPGAPTPDYVMPDRFFDPAGDTLTYRGFIDEVQFAAGALPTNGIDSIHRDLGTGETTVSFNFATNFAGQTGTVSAVQAVPTRIPLFATLTVITLAGLTVLQQRRRRSVA